MAILKRSVDFVGRVRFYLLKAHQRYFRNDLIALRHLGVITQLDLTADDLYPKKQFHSVERWLHKLVDEHQIARLDGQPGFF